MSNLKEKEKGWATGPVGLLWRKAGKGLGPAKPSSRGTGCFPNGEPRPCRTSWRGLGSPPASAICPHALSNADGFPLCTRPGVEEGRDSVPASEPRPGILVEESIHQAAVQAEANGVRGPRGGGWVGSLPCKCRE